MDSSSIVTDSPPTLPRQVNLRQSPPHEAVAAPNFGVPDQPLEDDQPAVTDTSPTAISEVESDPNGILDVNPALARRQKVTLDIDVFPANILRIINVTYSFRPIEKDGDLFLPLVGEYRCTWNEMPISMEEKSEVWAGAEYASTTWISSVPLGVYPALVAETVIRSLQGLNGPAASIEMCEKLIGEPCSEEKARSLGRIFAARVTQGDNHIMLLTAAYCLLFDHLWGYVSPPASINDQ
jgi:hypothetical protein